MSSLDACWVSIYRNIYIIKDKHILQYNVVSHSMFPYEIYRKCFRTQQSFPWIQHVRIVEIHWFEINSVSGYIFYHFPKAKPSCYWNNSWNNKPTHCKMQNEEVFMVNLHSENSYKSIVTGVSNSLFLHQLQRIGKFSKHFMGHVGRVREFLNKFLSSKRIVVEINSVNLAWLEVLTNWRIERKSIRVGDWDSFVFWVENCNNFYKLFWEVLSSTVLIRTFSLSIASQVILMSKMRVCTSTLWRISCQPKLAAVLQSNGDILWSSYSSFGLTIRCLFYTQVISRKISTFIPYPIHLSSPQIVYKALIKMAKHLCLPKYS